VLLAVSDNNREAIVLTYFNVYCSDLHVDGWLEQSRKGGLLQCQHILRTRAGLILTAVLH